MEIPLKLKDKKYWKYEKFPLKIGIDIFFAAWVVAIDRIVKNLTLVNY